MSRFELLRVVTSKSRLIVRIEGTTIKASHSTTTYVRRIETGLNAFQFFCVVLFLFFVTFLVSLFVWIRSRQCAQKENFTNRN